MQFEKGSLRRQIVHTTEHARASGALLPIPTDYFFVEDRGVRFFVRVLASLSRKDEARKEQKQRERTGKKINPFLPPEKELTVADVSKTHIAVLNKFSVMEHHLLIVTREFEDQDMLLTPGDFEALRICMKEYRSLGFYNGGQEAGASQQHRHLQLVPLPLAPEGPDVPIEQLLAEASFRGPGRVPGFPFLHAFARMDRDFDSRAAYDLYNILLASVAMTTSSPGALVRQSRPYCLLMTDEWMLLVPRSREFFEDISFNSLAFAGSLFVRSEKQLERLKTAGPVNTLASVALPR